VAGTLEELREQIIAVALDRAFLLDPLPTDEFAFKRRVDEGRGRLTLIANEVARLAGTILVEFAAAARKVKDTKNAPDAVADCTQQLQRLVPKRFMQATPWEQLAALRALPQGHYLAAGQIPRRPRPRRHPPNRTANPLEQRYWRLVAERKGSADERMPSSAGCWKSCA
jgi:ATP-dependent helicase HrpA